MPAKDLDKMSMNSKTTVSYNEGGPVPEDYIGNAAAYFNDRAEYKAQLGKEHRTKLSELTLDNMKKTLGMEEGKGGALSQAMKAGVKKLKAVNRMKNAGLGPMNEGSVKQN